MGRQIASFASIAPSVPLHGKGEGILARLRTKCHLNYCKYRNYPRFLFPGKAQPLYCSGMLNDKDSLLRRLHVLRSEHRDLDTVIARANEQGPIDQLHLQRLKKRKLGLRDEIARLESRLIPDRTA